MAIGGRKYQRRDQRLAEAQAAAIASVAGISEAAFLAAAADGVITESEVALIAQIINDVCGGHVTVDDAAELITACAEAFEAEGFEARMDGIADLLPNAEAQLVALFAVSAVILGDDEYDDESEGAFYDDFAARLGCPEDLAADIWNSQLENFGWS
jgi:uncharacterized membrane protein YebE (DUF533 family)